MLSVGRLFNHDGNGLFRLLVCPSQLNCGVVHQTGFDIEWRHEEFYLLSKTVDIILNVGVTIAEGVSIGIVDEGIEAVGRLPLVSHSIAILIGDVCAVGHISYTAYIILIGNKTALLAQRGELGDDALVVNVTNA